jgi:hypothetical protein
LSNEEVVEQAKSSALAGVRSKLWYLINSLCCAKRRPGPRLGALLSTHTLRLLDVIGRYHLSRLAAIAMGESVGFRFFPCQLPGVRGDPGVLLSVAHTKPAAAAAAA